MYDDLVKRLRCQQYGNCPACVNWYTEEVEPNLWRERCMAIDAADAIEEMQRCIDGVEADNDSLCEQLQKSEADNINLTGWLAEEHAKHQWVPVEERLPEEKINPITHDFESIICSTNFGDVRVYKYGTPIGWNEPHFWHGAGIMDRYVTNWMPLPEPPKEDA